MDDPWGSPWASSETTSKHDPPIPSPPKNLLSPPPRAFFGSTSNLQSQSPWADDVGFGDWTGTEQTDLGTNALDWGVWAEPSSQTSHPSPRLDDLVKRSSIALPSSAATSPGLRPLPRSRASSVFRHHSPDPWATEIPLHDKRNDSPTRFSGSLGVSVICPQGEALETPIPSAQQQEVGELSELRVDDTLSKEEDERISDGASQVYEPSRPSLDPIESYDAGRNAAPKVEIHDTPSRPSSTFSVDSSNVIERQDSPITSIDEDPKSRLRTVSRNASGKVQELVGMYDGLAKTAIEEPPPPTRLDLPRERSRGRSPSQTRSTDGEDDGDFGDFEDAKSEYEKPAPTFDAPSASSGRLSTPTNQSGEKAFKEQTDEPAGREISLPGTASVSIQRLVEKFGPIRYDVDFRSIEKLYPDLAEEADDNTIENSEIPDRVIDDNFTTISERKTWYRISRYGSMRKHDSGDDDNYHRVDWPTSHLHSDVIKIVRRWMEEDSISGRAMLGAGKRTSAFNWDSSAAPVDLGKVFARKASISRSQKSPIPPPIQDSRQSIGSDSEPRRSLKSPIQPPDSTFRPKATGTPNFGWSSEHKSSTADEIPSNKIQNERIESPNIQTPATTEAENKTQDAVQTTAQPNRTEIALEDEDDWGEMVSSPQVEVHPGPTLMTKSLNYINEPASTSVSVSDSTPRPELKNVVAVPGNNLAPKLSVSIPQSSQAPQQASDRTGPSSAAPRLDPWPLADFSIFENLSARTPRSPRRDPWPLADFSIFDSPTSGAVSNSANSLKTKRKSGSKPSESKNVQASVDKTSGAQTPLKAVLGPIENSTHERDQDNIVKSIVQNLPDLSYMLR
ncbi:hypothetical protein F4776DRAFT_587176 [Hypoxylon sp. NC0597]|nr:hypothetical protein F4776DRAFT_587176 [Hypoxylon sp. NC0597]